MKGAFEDNMKPVPSCAAGSDAVAGQTRQALEEVNRSKARTSAAVLGLAISMGASSLLVPQQGKAAVTENLPTANQGNWMPASPKADLSIDPDPTDGSTSSGREVSQTEEPVSPVNQLSQEIGGVSATDEPMFTLNVRATGATVSTNLQQPPAESLSAIEPAASTEADMGKPEPSFLATPISSKQPEFLLSGNPTTAASLEVSLPAVNPLPEQGLGMAGLEGTPIATAQPLHQTITQTIVTGSGSYTAAQSDAIERQEMLMEPASPLAASQQHKAVIQAGITPELDVTQINREYSHPIPVPEMSSETEAVNPVETAPETADANPGQDLATWSESAVAREVHSETETDRPIAIKPVESQFTATPLPLESNPESSVVSGPNLTNAVVIESDTAVAPASRIYQVGTGETLDTIAEKNNLSVSDLMAANQIGDPNFIKAKQTIKIPLLDRENSASLNHSQTDSDRSSAVGSDIAVNESADPIVLGTDAIYPLAPNRRAKANAESLDSDSFHDPQAKAPYVDSLKADLEKLREKYPIAKSEAEYQSQPELPIESAWQPSNQGVVSVPDLPVADGQPILTAVQIAPGSQDVASENPDEISPSPDNGYVQGLRADIERLQQSQSEPASANVQWSANENNPSGELGAIAPEQPSEDSNQVFQAAIENKPEKRQRPVRTSPENAKAPREDEPTSEDLLATGSSGTAAYQPLLQPTTGQMVSPQLPPLNSPDTYLPNSPAIFTGYIWPAEGVLTSGYGWRWGRMHNGIDIAGPVGTPIFAAASGVVTYAGWNDGGYGNLIEIEHTDGSFTVYAHNNRILVREGQEVDQGQQVAEMGNTGFSTGPHLHFEIHPSGQGAANPIAYLPQK